MKKLTSLLFALVFALAGVCSAAAEGLVFSTDYYSLTLPENWIIDTEDLTSSEEAQELGHFYDSGEVGLLVSAYLVRLEDTEGQPVWSAETGMAQEYVDLVLADFEDSHPEYLGTVLAGEVPFLLIKGGDNYGEFLYAYMKKYKVDYIVAYEILSTYIDEKLARHMACRVGIENWPSEAITKWVQNYFSAKKLPFVITEADQVHNRYIEKLMNRQDPIFADPV